MRHAFSLLVLAATTAFPALAQDVVVMRRPIAAPKPKATTAPVASLLVNGDFSNGLTGWNLGGGPSGTLRHVSDGGEGGSPALLMDGSTHGGTQVSQFPKGDPARTYLVTARVRYDSANGYMDIYEYNTGRKLDSAGGAASAGKWITLSGAVRPVAGGEIALLVRLNRLSGTNAGTAYVDTVTLTPQ